MKNSKLKALMLQKNAAMLQQKENQEDFLVINEESLYRLQGGTAGPCEATVELEAGTCTGNTCGIYTSCSNCNENGCKQY